MNKELTGSQYISYLNISVNSRFLFFKCNFRWMNDCRWVDDDVGYLEPCQTSDMQFSVNIVGDQKTVYW